MMNGKPQTLTSKFKISYNLLLNLLDIGDNNLVQFANRSMVTGELDNQMNHMTDKMSALNIELQNLKACLENLRTPLDTIKQYIELELNLGFSANKKRKEIERQLVNIRDNYKYYELDKATYNKFINKEKEINDVENQINNLKTHIQSEVDVVLQLLYEEYFTEKNESEEEDKYKISLSLKGKIASKLRETHCLVFANLLEDKILDNLSSKQLVSLFSCFTNITVKEDYKDFSPYTDDNDLKKIMNDISNLYLDYQQKEIDYRINSGIDYNIHYDLLGYVNEWCDSENVEDCKIVLQRLSTEKEIFLGEFVKALLKINNISSELEKIAEMTGNIAFLSKLKQIPSITLKYVVTNQSLYV
jgi:superfamily II RNA helicase